MEKNVGSIDLEELKKAREELNQERGIETDPNMYANYNPNRNEEQSSYPSAEAEIQQETLPEQDEDLDIVNMIDNIMSENTEESSEVENTEFNLDLNPEASIPDEAPVQPEVDDAPINFSIYDKFADFEIKNEFAGRVDEVENTSVYNDEVENVQPQNEMESMPTFTEEELIAPTVTSSVEVNENGDRIINISVPIEISNDAEDVFDEESEVFETSATESVETDNFELNNFEVEQPVEKTQSFDSVEQESVKEVAEIESFDVESDAVENNYASNDDDFDNVFKQGKLGELLASEDSSNDLSALDSYDSEPIGSHLVDDEMLSKERKNEILNAISEIRPINSKLEEEQEEPQHSDEDIYKVEVVPFDTIGEYDFLEVIGSNAFKLNNSLAYLIGKDEEGELVFENIKTMHNTAVFGPNEKQLSSYISGMILSLMIKNSPEDFKFVVCDPSLRSGYDVFEGSSYMWFDSVKKSEDDVFDALDKLVNELEERYQNFAKINVKSIYEFNEFVEPEYQMPHILFVFSNYSNIYHYSNADEINATLYAILKLGRLVGIHTILSSAEIIENSNINFNLPTRIVFKPENIDDGQSMLGDAGAEKLSLEDELLHFAVSEDEPIHLKAAKLRINEIRLILQNIES